MPAEERTEKATGKKRQDERKKGNVPQSQDLISVASLFAAFYGLQFLGPTMVEQLQSSLYTFFTMAASIRELKLDDLSNIFIEGVKVIGICILPMLLVCGITSIVLTLAQTKMLVSKEAFKFKPSKLNPLNGLKKMFSMRGIVELVKSSLKLTVIFYLVYTKYQSYIPRIARLMDMDISAAISLVSEFIIGVINTAGAIFLFLAAADYFYQWWEYEKNIRMTKQEVKEEYKHMEGDPQIKNQIRQRQRKMSQSRMAQSVPTADVVIRNPTHYAIAIKYDSENNRAPVVVAKGADLVAQRIIAIALENNITTVENRTLARGLFEAVDIDREIPEKFYQPVAEVLAFVYSLRDKAKKGK